MASKNVETLRAAHESWNKRNFPGVVKNAAEGLVYTDNARAITLSSRHKFREWTEEWAKAFSDGRITNPEYVPMSALTSTKDAKVNMKQQFDRHLCEREDAPRVDIADIVRDGDLSPTDSLPL